MSYCPSNSTSGFIELTGPIPAQSLVQSTNNQHTSMVVNEAPFETSFGSRSTPPGLNSNHIVDTSGNKCTYLGNTYNVIDIQICTPLHKGYSTPGIPKESSAEMIVSLAVTGSNQVSGILLCVPIFDVGSSKNDTYLSQIINKTNISPAATLDSVFVNQRSFGYRTCFETMSATQTVTSYGLMIFVFPAGIQLSRSDFTLLKTSISGTLPRYGIPPVLRGTESTVESYTYENGNKKSTSLSSNGYSYTLPLPTCDDKFSKVMKYFLKGPIIPSRYGSHNSGTSSTSYTTSQYKCVPFDQNRIVSEERGQLYVSADNTDVSLQAKVIEQQKKNESVSSNQKKMSTAEIEIMLAYGGGAIIVAIIAGIAVAAYKSQASK